MVRRLNKEYLVKRRGKVFSIGKEALTARNYELFAAFKGSSDPEERASILQEYYDLNRKFVHYFPQFRDDYRDEIVNTFVTLIPYAIDNFDPNKGTGPNSYLAMYAKKSAITKFLESLNTVHFNHLYKDKHGKTRVTRAKIQSMDAVSDESRDGDEGSAVDAFLGKTVFKDFLNGNDDGAREFLVGPHSYGHYFTGMAKKVVLDFEAGYLWQDVMNRNKMTQDGLLLLIIAIRMQLARILKSEGKDVKFIRRSDRGPKVRRPSRIKRKGIDGDIGGVDIPQDRIESDDIGSGFGDKGNSEGNEITGPEGAFFSESDGPETWEGWSEA